jgi:hypothetical protein
VGTPITMLVEDLDGGADNVRVYAVVVVEVVGLPMRQWMLFFSL